MAWVTIADGNRELPELSGSGSDTLLTALLARADTILASYSGYEPATAGASPTLQSASYTEYPAPWQVEDEGITLRLLHAPVTAVSSIYDSPDRSYGSSDLVASTDYDLRANGTVVLVYNNTHGAWSKYHDALKVAYTAGYTTPTYGLFDALVALTTHLYRRQDRQGKTSTSVQGGSESYRDETLPKAIKEMVQAYILPGVL